MVLNESPFEIDVNGFMLKEFSGWEFTWNGYTQKWEPLP